MEKTEYQQRLKKQYNPYKEWLANRESRIIPVYDGSLSYACLSHREFIKLADVSDINEDIIILTGDDGELTENAVSIILSHFEKSNSDFIYADEDYYFDKSDISLMDDETAFLIGVDKANTMLEVPGRIAPWFKPDYSPENLLSFSYFGNICAFKKEALSGVKLLNSLNANQVIYDFFLKAAEKVLPEHIHEVLFTNHSLPDLTQMGCGEEFDAVKRSALLRRKEDAFVDYDKNGLGHLIYQHHDKQVSIVIPSKDHPDLLSMCIGSIRENTCYTKYDITVIDNGSSEDNRREIEDLAEKYKFNYIYEKEDFNFSSMCNKGAKHTNGELILFLNDDIEITSSDWLGTMVGQLLCDGVGAVGAKLFYPGSDIIQHCGISLAVTGPVHRLHGLTDSHNYYYGRNKLEYDCIGVTAACMLVRRSLFEELGGFCEDIRVAYNDVDLCFRIHERGYRLVVRNDVTLIHHESVSRGLDDSGEKKKRLDSERSLLYSRHSQFDATRLMNEELEYIDPFCAGTELWKRDSHFSVGILEPSDNRNSVCQIEEISPYTPTAKGLIDRSMPMLSIDLIEEEKGYIFIRGWALVTKKDNAFTECKLIIQNDKKAYLSEVFDELREDVEKAIEGQTNTALSGFVARFPKIKLEPGEYTIGVKLINRKKTYISFSEKRINV